MNVKLAGAMVLVVVALSGCASPEPVYTRCSNPRPEICTREFRPVCAARDKGIRCVTTPCDTWQYKTYGNACTACADNTVSHFRVGACEAETSSGK